MLASQAAISLENSRLYREQNHALVGVHDIVKDRFRQRGCGHGLVAQTHNDRVAGRGFRLDPQLGPSRKNQQPALGTCCSIAVRMSVSISFSRTISPDTACETLITVARSRCSTGAPIVPVGPGAALVLPQVADRARSSCRTLPSAPHRR